jgi:hypothetical protein
VPRAPLTNYLQVDRLVPEGFFTAKTAIWSLEREKTGVFPKGTYLAYLQIEWARSEPEKRKIVDALIRRVPAFAPAWKESAMLQEKLELRLTELEHGLGLNPDPETEGLLKINKATALHSLGKSDDCVKLLGALALATNSTTGTKALARATLALVLEKK